MGSITDMGIMAAAAITNIGQQAVATITTLAQIKIAVDEYKLAGEYMTISEEARSHYETVFAPKEDQELQDASMGYSTPPLYELWIVRRMRAGAGKGFIGMGRKSIQTLSRYATGKAAHILITVEKARIDALTYAQLAGDQVAFIKQQSLLDRGYARVIAALKRGHDMSADSFNMSMVPVAAYKSLQFSHNMTDFVPTKKEEYKYDREQVVSKPLPVKTPVIGTSQENWRKSTPQEDRTRLATRS